MKKNVIILTALAFVLSAFIFQSCSAIKDISNTLANISKLQFKLDNVTNFRLVGIDLGTKRSVTDFNISDGLKLTNAFATKSFPATFVVHLNALNPNDGSNKTQKTNATIAGLDYRLLLDDVQTISGDIQAPISVPGTGQSVNIPLSMSLDLLQFFGNRSYESIMNLALALGGVNGTAAKVKLDIKPTVNTAIGPITYPSRLTVIDKEWR
jgi:LEA14-like dessication related protein